MCRLIRGFAGHTHHIVGNLMSRLIYELLNSSTQCRNFYIILIPQLKYEGCCSFLDSLIFKTHFPYLLLEVYSTHIQSGKSGTIPVSNQASGVSKSHYAQYYVRKSTILLAWTGVRKISSVAFSEYPKSFISRINEFYVFFNKISL